jgi:hypothetical protein
MWLGISADELRRVRDADEKLTHGRMRTNYYPLIELGMTRDDCIAYIAASGYPVPPKSACDICPFSSKRRLIENIAANGGTYERITEIQAKWHENGKHPTKYLTVFLDALPNPQQAKEMSVGGEDNSGACGVCEF